MSSATAPYHHLQNPSQSALMCDLQVDITLEEPDAGTTVLRLKQTGIPHEDRFGNADVLRSVEAGWQDQIFRRIKMVFGYGM